MRSRGSMYSSRRTLGVSALLALVALPVLARPAHAADAGAPALAALPSAPAPSAPAPSAPTASTPSAPPAHTTAPTSPAPPAPPPASAPKKPAPPVAKAPAKPASGKTPAKSATKSTHVADPVTRRIVSGGPSVDDAAAGAESPELRTMREAERELFPPASPALGAPWPTELPSPLAASLDRP